MRIENWIDDHQRSRFVAPHFYYFFFFFTRWFAGCTKLPSMFCTYVYARIGKRNFAQSRLIGWLPATLNTVKWKSNFWKFTIPIITFLDAKVKKKPTKKLVVVFHIAHQRTVCCFPLLRWHPTNEWIWNINSMSTIKSHTYTQTFSQLNRFVYCYGCCWCCCFKRISCSYSRCLACAYLYWWFLSRTFKMTICVIFEFRQNWDNKSLLWKLLIQYIVDDFVCFVERKLLKSFRLTTCERTLTTNFVIFC